MEVAFTSASERNLSSSWYSGCYWGFLSVLLCSKRHINYFRLGSCIPQTWLNCLSTILKPMPGSWSSEVRRNSAWWVWTKASSTALSCLKKAVGPKVSMARLKIKRLLNCQGQKFFLSSTSSNMPAHTEDNWTVLNTQKTLHLSSKVSQLTQLSSGACGPRNRILETDSQAFLKVSENKIWTL